MNLHSSSLGKSVVLVMEILMVEGLLMVLVKFAMVIMLVSQTLYKAIFF